ncbi:MAG: type IV secretory system conjugative DNA transfer family protein, partial [Deinococcus sp.]
MTTLRAPRASRFTRTQHLMIAWMLTLVSLAAVTSLIAGVTRASLAIGRELLTAPVHTPTGVTSWGHVLAADSPGLAALKCSFNQACSPWFNTSFNLRYDLQLPALQVMLSLLAMVFAWRQIPGTSVLKDPGQGKWAGLDDKQVRYLVRVPTSDLKFRAMLNRLDRWSPASLYLGHFIPWVQGSGDFAWTRPRLALLRERGRHENVLVTGAPGSGKTRGAFRQNIVLDAHYDRTAIVFDMKWPQLDSGFGDPALYWHRLGRRVCVF